MVLQRAFANMPTATKQAELNPACDGDARLYEACGDVTDAVLVILLFEL